MLKDLKNKLLGQEKEDGQHNDVVPKGIANFALKSFSIFVGLFITLLLTNNLSKADWGHYQYAFSWSSMLMLLSLLGFDRLTVREFSRLRSSDNWGKIGGVFRWSDRLIFFASLIIAAIAFCFSYFPFEMFEDKTTVMTYRLGLLVVPLMALMSHRRAALNGIREVLLAQVPGKLVQPVLFLLLLAIGILPHSFGLDAITAIWLSIGSFVVAVAVGQYIWHRKKIKEKREQVLAPKRKQLLRMAFGILFFNLAMAAFAKIDILMLRPMTSADEVGLYSIPLKLASYINFIIVSFNAVIAPNIAKYHAEGNTEGIQNIVTKASKALAVLGVLAALFLVVGHTFILGLFGEDYLAGDVVLFVLIGGQLINVFCGPVGNILIMADQEWLASKCFLVAIAVNISLNFWLIPEHGMLGAAIATSIGVAVANFLLLYFVVTKLGINPTIFRFKRK